MNREELNRKQREARVKNNNIHTKKYEKTKKGFLVRMYRNMQSRILGIQQKKAHLYLGKEILDKNEFYEWALNNPEFHRTFDKWEAEGYERRIAPSIDRINSDYGYTLDNIRIVEFHHNCRNIKRSC